MWSKIRGPRIIVILRKIKTILILISFKRYFSHPEKSILNLSLPYSAAAKWQTVA